MNKLANYKAVKCQMTDLFDMFERFTGVKKEHNGNLLYFKMDQISLSIVNKLNYLEKTLKTIEEMNKNSHEAAKMFVKSEILNINPPVSKLQK